jgi:hypothetical protein
VPQCGVLWLRFAPSAQPLRVLECPELMSDLPLINLPMCGRYRLSRRKQIVEEFDRADHKGSKV